MNLVPSARGIEAGIARELAPLEGAAAAHGEKAGAALGGAFVSKFASKTGNLLQGLDRQLGSFGGPFTGSLTTIGTSLRSVESGQLKVAAGASDLERIGTAAYVGVGLAAGAFGAISVKAALGAEQAQAQLEQALTATGHAADDWGGKISGATKKLAAFGFDQEEVNASLAALVRATKDPAKSIDLVATAADIARAKNLDLASATQLLVNIEAGRVRGLTTLGISTKDANGKTIDAATAVQRITDLYGGAAKANADTYKGELQAVGAEAHNLEEELGTKLLPVVADLGKELLGGVHGLESINSATHGWAGTLTEAALVGGGLIVVGRRLTAVLDGVAEGEGAAAGAAVTLNAGLAEVAPALIAVAGGFILGKKAGDEINKALRGAKPSVDDLTTSLRLLGQQGQSGTGFDFSKLAGDLKTIQGSTIEKGFGFAGSSHQAVSDISAVNDALEGILKTSGVKEAGRDFEALRDALIADGISAGVVNEQLDPFLRKMGSELPEAADAAHGAVQSLAQDFSDLATGFGKHSDQLGLLDQLDAVKTAITELTQDRLDAVGQGQKSIDAARTEANANQSLSDAYRSANSAASSLADAKEKLAQFEGPTDTQIRSLERTQIQDRIVTTPEEARQKEIDLLTFDENTANQRESLQKQVASAEDGVTSATRGVARAQQAVSDASAARRKIQTDAAAAIESAERKAQEAILGAGQAIQKADVAGHLGAGNQQLEIYVTLLDQLARSLDPTSPLAKNLDIFLFKVAASTATAQKLPPGFAPLKGVTGPPAGLLAPTSSSGGLRAGLPGGLPSGLPSGFTQHNTYNIHANDVPSRETVDVLNRKQAIRLAAAGARG